MNDKCLFSRSFFGYNLVQGQLVLIHQQLCKDKTPSGLNHKDWLTVDANIRGDALLVAFRRFLADDFNPDLPKLVREVAGFSGQS